jgi:hypothetical protein
MATVRPDDDPLARQRQIIARHPLRALNAINVRVLGVDLLTVHVQLNNAKAEDSGHPVPTMAAQPVGARTSPRSRCLLPRAVAAIAVIAAESNPHSKELEVGSGRG